MPTHYQGSPESRLALDTFIKLTRAVNAFENRLYAHDVIEGLTPSQFGVLETLYHLGPLCQGEVSSKLLKSSGNITLVVDKTGQTFLDDQKIDLPTLAQRLSQAAADAPDTEIQLRADAAVPYGRIVEVMGVAQKAGLNHIGFVAEPPSVP